MPAVVRIVHWTLVWGAVLPINSTVSPSCRPTTKSAQMCASVPAFTTFRVRTALASQDHGSPSGAPRPSLSGSGSSRGVNSREIELMQ